MHLTAVIEFLKTTNELEVAEQLLDTFAKYAQNMQQFDTIGMLYEKIKLYKKSLVMLEKCRSMVIYPQEMKAVRSNLAKVYNHLNEPLKSLFYSELNLEIDPNNYEARMEQSFSYYLCGDYHKSWEIQNELLADKNISENVKNRINFNMGTFDMYKGNFQEGLRKMILGGKAIGLWKKLEKPFPRWEGEQTDKVVLVYAEAGIGDEIINIRFMREFERRNMKAVWVGFRKETNDLFRNNGFNIIDDDKNLDPLDEYVFTEAMSLPILLKMELNQLWNGPYLKPKDVYIEKWKTILPENFITIKWAGNPYYDHDLHRTVPLENLLPAAKKFNMPIISLQFEEGKYESDEVINVDIKDWDDTLAIQYLAKLNITSCTSTAHSASAIGAKCAVLPPICTYYPWVGLKEDYTSYWYGENTKAFVQTEWRSWTKPLAMLDILQESEIC